jgi:aminopeptidase N
VQQGLPQAIALADYQAPDYRTVKTDLIFDIRDGVTEVTSTLDIQRQNPQGSVLQLDGQELELVSVELDGRLLSSNEFQIDGEQLLLQDLQDQHQLRIVTRIHPEQNTALEGLYRSSKMYCTQCEAQGFRKITYYQDRPDVLSKFTTTIIADGARYPNLLSNGNLIAEEQLADGRKKVTWEDPFAKPCYLFALVAGDLAVLEDQFITMSGRNVALKIFSEPHNIEQCHYAMDALKRSMRWDEERFGREYDLDIFMIVAVEDFNMGAMENKGLNIFNTSCVLASKDTATDDAYQRVEAVVAHEYFHNWSGNRVTCRDWFQLSLKEGFTVFRDAEFSADMNSRAVKRIEDVGFLRSIQFAEDASPLAHPIRPSSYIEISNFYTTTIYEKGAEVVGMYRTLLGDEKFRRGTDLYFERHDGQAATTDDFMRAMSDAGDVDLQQFRRWYEQAGTPNLRVEERYENATLTLSIEQSCPPTPGQERKLPFHMPVLIGLLGKDGQDLAIVANQLVTEAEVELRDNNGSVMVNLREPMTQLAFTGLTEKPVVSFLRQFSAPVKVQYDRPAAELDFLARHDQDGFVRWDAMQSMWMSYFDKGASETDARPQDAVRSIAEQALTLNRSDEKLLAATMLAVPSELYLFEQLRGFDAHGLLDARDAGVALVATQSVELWHRLYETYAARGRHQVDADSIAARALANIGFNYWCRSLAAQGEVAQLQSELQKRYSSVDNLTDRLAVMALVCRLPEVEETMREEILHDFYAKWEQQALVIDLWFNLQAQSPITDIAGVKKLIAHPSFDLKNPNRVRSVYGAFGMLNLRRLHALDGSGYRFVADAVAEIDALNPQIAARLATPLTRWKKFDGQRQQLMQHALRGLLDGSDRGPSKDLFEIVSKSLAG